MYWKEIINKRDNQVINNLIHGKKLKIRNLNQGETILPSNARIPSICKKYGCDIPYNS